MLQNCYLQRNSQLLPHCTMMKIVQSNISKSPESMPSKWYNCKCDSDAEDGDDDGDDSDILHN
jgi:hypothetical protein